MVDKIEGVLKKNSINRFEIPEYEFTCGSTIQILHSSGKYWLVGRVEADSRGYYFFSEYYDLPHFHLETGMKVRVGYEPDHIARWMVRLAFFEMGDEISEYLPEKNQYKLKLNNARKKFDKLMVDLENLPCFEPDVP